MQQSYKNIALFMALALTAAPALAGTSRGGASRASTDEHATLSAGESPTAESKTVEQPLAGHVNIQPKVQADGTLVADPEANAKLRASAEIKSDKDQVTQGETRGSADNGGGPVAAGATRGAGGRVGLTSGAKDGSAK